MAHKKLSWDDSKINFLFSLSHVSLFDCLGKSSTFHCTFVELYQHSRQVGSNCSGTRCGKILPIGQDFKSLYQNLSVEFVFGKIMNLLWHKNCNWAIFFVIKNSLISNKWSSHPVTLDSQFIYQSVYGLNSTDKSKFQFFVRIMFFASVFKSICQTFHLDV